MAEVSKGKPQKMLKLFILVEVLKEGLNKVWGHREGASRSAPRTSTSIERDFGATETRVARFSVSLFLGSHNQHFLCHCLLLPNPIIENTSNISESLQECQSYMSREKSFFPKGPHSISPSCLQEALSKHFREPASEPAEHQAYDRLWHNY